MSSIIASSAAAAPSSTPATGRGVLSSASMPIDCASRRAGSMVSTTTVRPRSAARSASAAEVVVLPTPPEPQHTMMPIAGSSSSASTSRRGRGAAGRRAGPTRAAGPRHEAQSLARLSVGGQLVEPAEVDAAGQAGQLVRRHVQAGDQLALRVLQRPALGVVAGLGEQAVDQRVVAVRRRPRSGRRRPRPGRPCPRGRRRGPRRRGRGGGPGSTTTPPTGRPGLAQLGDAVGGLLHGHLLQHGHQVHGGARRAEQRHHACRPGS